MRKFLFIVLTCFFLTGCTPEKEKTVQLDDGLQVGNVIFYQNQWWTVARVSDKVGFGNRYYLLKKCEEPNSSQKDDRR